MRKCLLCCIALTLCIAVLFSISVCAGSISVDGYIQPEEWERASFSTLFTSEEESGCAVSYADIRVAADAPAKRISFAFQVIDEAFTGDGALSRVHIGFDNATFTFTAEGTFQTTEGGHTVQAAGFYQGGGYNRDYVLEAVIISPRALRGGKLPFSVWFTDGKGVRSKACELTVDTGLPAEPETSAPETVPCTTTPQTEQPEPEPPVRPTRPDDPTYASVAQSTEKRTTADQPDTQRETRDLNPGSPVVYTTLSPKTASAPAAAAAGGYTPGNVQRASAQGETSVFTPQEVSIPATGEAGAGYWSAKRIAACAAAGACVLAAALLFLMQARKKEKTADPQG